jgi:hypothetical protein
MRRRGATSGLSYLTQARRLDTAFEQVALVNHSSTLPYEQAFLQSDCEHTSQLLTTHHVCDGDGGDDAVIDELLCRTPVLRSSCRALWVMSSDADAGPGGRRGKKLAKAKATCLLFLSCGS